MPRKSLFFLMIAVGILPAIAEAAYDIKVKNNSRTTIRVAIAYKYCWPVGQFGGGCYSQIRGRFTVEPGQTRSIVKDGSGNYLASVWINVNPEGQGNMWKPNDRPTFRIDPEDCRMLTNDPQGHRGECTIPRYAASKLSHVAPNAPANAVFKIHLRPGGLMDDIFKNRRYKVFVETNLGRNGGTFTWN